MRYKLIESDIMNIAKQIGVSPLSIKKANDKYDLKGNVKRALSNKKELTGIAKELVTKRKIVKAKIDKAERSLVNMGVDTNEIHKASKSIAKSIDKLNLTKLLDYISDFINNTPFLKKITDLGKSYGLTVVLIMIHGIVREFIVSLLPIKYRFVADIIICIFIAPITEETSKYISIKNDFKAGFFIVFNMAEWWLYVKRYLFAYRFGGITAGDVGVGMIVRFLCVMTHGVFTLVHDENNDSLSYFLLAVLLHAFHNTVATLLEMFGPKDPTLETIVGLLTVVGLPFIEKAIAIYMMSFMEDKEETKEMEPEEYYYGR